MSIRQQKKISAWHASGCWRRRLLAAAAAPVALCATGGLYCYCMAGAVWIYYYLSLAAMRRLGSGKVWQ